MKFVIQITTRVEYEVNPDGYGAVTVPEQMLAIDHEAALDDPVSFMEMDGADNNVQSWIVEEGESVDTADQE